MLERMIELCLPTIIGVCELMGIFVVAVTTVRAFWRYCWGMFQKRPCNVKFDLADGLATSLEFKMAAEILKTVVFAGPGPERADGFRRGDFTAGAAVSADTCGDEGRKTRKQVTIL